MKRDVLLLCHGRSHEQDPRKMNIHWDILDHETMQRSVQVDKRLAANPDISLDLGKASDLRRLTGPYSMIICMNCVATVHDVVQGRTGPRVSFWKWVAASLTNGGTFWGTVSTFGLRSYILQDETRHPDTDWAVETWTSASTNSEPPSASQFKALTKYVDMYKNRVTEITGGRLRAVPVHEVVQHSRAGHKVMLPIALVFCKISI